MENGVIAMRIILIVILSILAVAVLSFGAFAYHNLHWFAAYEKAIKKAGALEKQATLPNGRVINFGEVENKKPALLLIHGQGGAWEDYGLLLSELSQSWHIYAVDVYGHGQSSHDTDGYYIDENGNDLIWFVEHIIKEKVVIAGHSNGALTAAYIAAYGKPWVNAVLLEDPPVFSTEGEDWENSFSYLDTFKNIHDYELSDKSECWEAYYLRHCYWGKLFMKGGNTGIANYAQKYHEKHQNAEVKLFFMPPSVTLPFHYNQDYDHDYGEHFYDLSWNHGFAQKNILEKIEVPCIYLHAKENRHENGVYLCAASREQAQRATGYIGENCRLIDSDTSDHAIHTKHKQLYLDSLNSLLPEEL